MPRLVPKQLRTRVLRRLRGVFGRRVPQTARPPRAGNGATELRALRGKLRLSLDLAELRRDRP